MSKCDFEKGKIKCARDAEKVIVVRVRGRNIARWETCAGHHVWFWHIGQDVSKQQGGQLSTAKLTGPKQRAAATAEFVHPYLRMSALLHNRMNEARQKRGKAANTFMIEAIEKSITEIEESG